MCVHEYVCVTCGTYRIYSMKTGFLFSTGDVIWFNTNRITILVNLGTIGRYWLRVVVVV